MFVTRGGMLSLADASITTTGNTSPQEASSFYGLNAGVLAAQGGKITITGGSITTGGAGANGAFATGTGSEIIIPKVTIKASGGGGMVSWRVPAGPRG